MEKYLRKTDVSVGSDASVAHTTFNFTAWGDGINNSQIDSEVSQRLTVSKAPQMEGGAAKTSLAKVSPSKASPAGHKGDQRRSSIPRPCASSRVFAGAEPSSAVKPKAEIVGACHRSTPSSDRTFTVDNAKRPQPQAATAKTSLEAPQRSSEGCTDLSHLPRTPPAPRAEQTGLSRFNGSSAPPPGLKSGDQPQQDKANVSVEKKATLREATSEDKHVGVALPTPNPTSGEWTGLSIRVFKDGRSG